MLALLLTLSLLLSLFGWGRRLLFPFQLFTTWVHECWHAFMALILGAQSIEITLSPDGSGLTHFRIPKSRLSSALVACAGYLGASLTGCLLFLLVMQIDEAPLYWSARTVLTILCVMIGVSLLFWIRNWFGWFCMLLLGGGLAGFAHPKLYAYADEALLFLAIQTALNAVFDIRTLFALGSAPASKSDAHAMQKLFFLPYWFWALAWMGISLGMIYLTFQATSMYSDGIQSSS